MADIPVEDIEPTDGAGVQGTVLPPIDRTLPPWPGTYDEVGGVRMHVRRTEPGLSPDGAPPAVYVHGLGGSSTNWTDLGALLAPLSRGIAVDLPGFGFSEPEDGFDFSLTAHAETLTRYLDGLDSGPVHLFGNSMGGAVATLVAARRPDLVRTLTLISPAVPDLRLDPRRLSDPRLALAFLPVVGKPVRRRLAAMPPRERARQVIELCFADPATFPEHRLEELAAEHGERMKLAWATPALTRSTVGIFRDWFHRGSRSLWSILPEVSAPTLVVWGTQDKVISARKAQRTVRLLPHGKLLLLTETGHVAQMEHPEAVAQAVANMWRAVDEGRW